MYQNLPSKSEKVIGIPHRYLCPFRSNRGCRIQKWSENRNRK